MEWISTEVESPAAGMVTVTVMWRDPDRAFLEACAMSALNKMIMPIEHSGGLNGYVLDYSWTHHEDSNWQVFGQPTKRYVDLTVRFAMAF